MVKNEKIQANNDRQQNITHSPGLKVSGDYVDYLRGHPEESANFEDLMANNPIIKDLYSHQPQKEYWINYKNEHLLAFLDICGMYADNKGNRDLGNNSAFIAKMKKIKTDWYRSRNEKNKNRSVPGFGPNTFFNKEEVAEFLLFSLNYFRNRRLDNIHEGLTYLIFAQEEEFKPVVMNNRGNREVYDIAKRSTVFSSGRNNRDKDERKIIKLQQNTLRFGERKIDPWKVTDIKDIIEAEGLFSGKISAKEERLSRVDEISKLRAFNVILHTKSKVFSLTADIDQTPTEIILLENFTKLLKWEIKDEPFLNLMERIYIADRYLKQLWEAIYGNRLKMFEIPDQPGLFIRRKDFINLAWIFMQIPKDSALYIGVTFTDRMPRDLKRPNKEKFEKQVRQYRFLQKSNEK